jgi:hypothetical protein
MLRVVGVACGQSHSKLRSCVQMLRVQLQHRITDHIEQAYHSAEGMHTVQASNIAIV